MQQLGFIQSKADPALHVFRQNGNVVYFLVYVDDILISGNKFEFVSQLVITLKNRFQIKDLGPLSTFLGIKATQLGASPFLSQEHYALDILRRAGMQHCQTISNPTKGKMLLHGDTNLPYDNPTHYHQLVGALQYLIITRPDLSFVVNRLC